MTEVSIGVFIGLVLSELIHSYFERKHDEIADNVAEGLHQDNIALEKENYELKRIIKELQGLQDDHE